MAIFSVLLIIGLHGASSLKVFCILALNYLLAKRLGGERLGPLILWVVNLAILFANELNDGHRFGSLHSSLAYLVCIRTNLNAQSTYHFIGCI